MHAPSSWRWSPNWRQSGATFVVNKRRKAKKPDGSGSTQRWRKRFERSRKCKRLPKRQTQKTLENSHPAKKDTFLTWQKPGKHELLPGLAVIIDDIILVARTATALLHCFIHMIEILQRHCITIIKLRKTRFFPARAEFVGVVVTKEGDSPAQSEHDVLQGLD